MRRPGNLLTFFRHNREINELYISTAVRSFALGLIGIFIPIYLLQQGFSLGQVFFFFGVLSVAHLAFTLPSVKIAAKWGFKHAIFLSVPFLIVAYLMLYTIPQFGWPLWAIGILFGLQNSLFWVSYHIDFARFSDTKKRGSEVGFAKIAASIFGFIGPLIGSFVLVVNGFGTLFIIVSALLVFSVVPLFFSEELHSPTKISLKGIFKKRRLSDFLGFIGYGMDSRAYLVLWPLFIFLFIFGESYTSLGAVTSLRLFASLVFILIIGKLSDKYKKRILRIGAALNILVWTLKGFVGKTSQVFVADTLHGGTQSMISVSVDACSYDKASKSESVVHYIAFREIMYHFGAAIFMFTLAAFSSLLFGFLIGGGVGSLLLSIF